MTTSLPDHTLIEDVGSVFLQEFTFQDGCDKNRTLPLVILEKPKRSLTPNHDCVSPQLSYVEWSCSAQLFRDAAGERGCLDHTISVRITLSTGTDVDVVINNVTSLLDQFKSAIPQLRLGPP